MGPGPCFARPGRQQMTLKKLIPAPQTSLTFTPPCSQRASSRVTFDGGAGCGAPTTRAASGAPGGAAPGRQASQTCRMRRARPGAGLANLSRIGARVARSQGWPKGRRSAAPWRLPALHSPRGDTEKGPVPAEAGNNGVPGAAKNTGDDACQVENPGRPSQQCTAQLNSRSSKTLFKNN